ncbi:MAG: MFS transporter [Candidatus Helarchaeota archaeon]|nr:MFS transporter [Candidatus Helarchaeota archaeon]
MSNATTDLSTEVTGYRWIVLIINWLAVFFIYAAWLFILVVFEDTPLNQTEQYWVWTLPFIGMACMALPAGLLIDKYGLKKTGFLGLSIVVVAAFWRSFGFNFFTLAASSILLGFGIGMVIPIGNKLISLWFGAKEIGTASGITVMAAGLGIAVSQSISESFLRPLLGSWTAVFLFYAICVVIVLFLWNFIREKAPKSLKRSRVPLRESLSKIIKNKYVLVLAGLNFVILAVFYTILKALHPIFSVKLADETLANLAISLISYAAMVSNVLMPIISDHLKNRKYLLLMAFSVLGPSVILVYFAEGVWIWLLSFVIGYMVGTITPIILAIPIELKGVGHVYVAGATGLMTAIGKVGALATPMLYLLVATSSTAITGFIFLAILIIGAILLTLPFPETAGKAREADTE